MRPTLLKDLGVIPYKQAWDMQEAILRQMTTHKQEGRGINPADTLILCEHPAVYTLGKSGNKENMLLSEENMRSLGVEVYHSNRGGDITFHGPGQLVAYPIFDLEAHKTDLGWYIRSLEEVVIRTVQYFDIQAHRNKGETGVWIAKTETQKERKICAIGVRCSRWVSMHGLALNVYTDLDYFHHIVPCGIQDKAVSSIEKETGESVKMSLVKKLLIAEFKSVFELSYI